MTALEIRQAITAYLHDHCGVAPDVIDSGRRLFSQGVLDSLQIVGLVAFLEERFDIKVAALDLSVDHFDSVPALVDFVQRRTRD